MSDVSVGRTSTGAQTARFETSGIKDGLGKAVGVATVPYKVVTVGMRHLADSAISLGIAGNRYNMRNAYRTEYSGVDRFGAKMGDIAGVALPVAAAALWFAKRGSLGGISTHP